MKRIVWLLCLCAALLPLAGCSGTRQAEAPQEAPVVLPYASSLAKQGITGSITLPKRPERVVTLTNSPVLALYELGVPQAAVPDTKILQWPEGLEKQAKKIQTGMRSNIDLESVIALHPDLVIAGFYAKDTYGKILEREGIPVYYVEAGPSVPFDAVKEQTLLFADAFGGQSEKAGRIRQRFARVEAQMAKEKEHYAGRQVMVIQGAPPRLFLQNRFGTVGSMLDRLGFINVAPAKGGIMVPLNRETALSYKPDLIVSVDPMGGAVQQQALMEKEFAAHGEYWNRFEAVRNKRVLYLPKWFAVSGGLEELDQLEYLMKELKRWEDRPV